jgi:hypothetical protein
MEIIDNEGGGESVVLVAGDSLKKVPKSHQRLLTPALKAAFDDPAARFAQIADRSPYANLTRWLRTLVNEGSWELHLNQGEPEEFCSAGYFWSAEGVSPATIGLPGASKLSRLPTEMRTFYSLVDFVEWNLFGWAGSIYSPELTPLTNYWFAGKDPSIDPAQTFAFGGSGCGDMLICTADSRGGWISHGSGQVKFLGTTAETIDWVFGVLADGRIPDLYDS